MHPSLLALALAAALVALAAPSAEAQRRPSGAAATVTACVDFYTHTNEAWLRAHPPSATAPERSRLAAMAAESAQRQEALLAAAVATPQSAVEAELGRFLTAGMDLVVLDAGSPAALRAALAPLATLRRPRDLPAVGAAFHVQGLAPMLEFLRLEGADGSSRPLAIAPAALGLVDPAFYLSPEAEARSLLGHYRGYVEAVLRASGLPEAEVGPAAEAVLQIETQLAQALAGEAAGTRSRDTLRAQDRRFVALGLADLLQRLDAPSGELVVVSPAYFATLARIAGERDVQRVQWFLRFRVAHRLAPDLDSAFRAAHERFFAQTLRGLPGAPARTEHLQAVLRRHQAFLNDTAYTSRNTPEGHLQRAAAVVEAVRAAAVALVGKYDAGAAARLAAVRIDIAGSATPAFDAEGLVFRADDHIGNLLRLSRWHEARVLADRSVAIEPIPAHLPTLRWIPATSTLAISAAALVPPLLDAAATTSAARDFGALGALAGHELSKAIDAGSRGAGLGPLFNGLQAAPHLRIDGQRTLPMNRADLAGLEFAWAAFQTVQPQADAGAKRAFFSAWAELWAKAQTPESLHAQVQTALYAPSAQRVNATLAQLPAFAEAFACRSGEPMRAASPIAVWR